MECVKIKNDKVDGDKSLYICSTEGKVPATSCYVIHAIKVRDLISCTCEFEFDRDAIYPFGPSTKIFECESCSSKSNTQFRKLASISGPDIPAFPGVGVSGSKILFAGGLISNDEAPPFFLQKARKFSKSIYEFETNPNGDPEPCIKAAHSSFGDFQEEKPQPLVVEVDGALYALAGRPQCRRRLLSFEVFCPATQKWLTMPTLEFPPGCFIPRHSLFGTLFSYAIVGSKILVASQESLPEVKIPTPPPHFCFDVSNPRQGWTRLSPRLPSFCGRALVVDLEHDDDKLMFTYEFKPEKKGSVVVVYHISHASSRRKLINILTPELPPEFSITQAHPFSFVHLGGPYVCLAISHFMEREMKFNGKLQMEKMRLLLLTFQFSFRKLRSAPPSSFFTRPLGFHIFEYDWSEESDPTFDADLLGCFLL